MTSKNPVLAAVCLAALAAPSALRAETVTVTTATTAAGVTIALGAGGTLANSGTITSAISGIVSTVAGALVQNTAGGLIEGTADNAFTFDTGASGTVLNTGAGTQIRMDIAGKTGFFVGTGGTASVVNSAGAGILADGAAFFVYNNDGATLLNTGPGSLVHSNIYNAVQVSNGSVVRVTNAITGAGANPKNTTGKYHIALDAFAFEPD
jgi:hypothetical protein